MAAMKKEMSEAAITSGDLSPIFAWLETNIWSKGCTLSTDELVKQVRYNTILVSLKNI